LLDHNVIASPAAPVAVPQLHAPNRPQFWVVVSLLTVYIVWGTTYLAADFALQSFPAYLLMGIRFVLSGGLLLGFLMLRRAARPTWTQVRNAGLVGVLLLVGGTGSVALAQERISSGLAATLIATAPLWTLVFNLIWKGRPARREWFGAGLGIVGVALLTMEGNLQANPMGVVIVLFAAASWAFGSVLSAHLDTPDSLMCNAVQMLIAGVVLLGVALLRGESMTAWPSTVSWVSFAYLVVLGSLAAMTAYMYLLDHVSPTLANSYSFVNPAIALLLGVVIGGDTLTGSALIALPVILIGVSFIATHRASAQPD
jgi:drug/metabolite transporter (DMT)-like permease